MKKVFGFILALIAFTMANSQVTSTVTGSEIIKLDPLYSGNMKRISTQGISDFVNTSSSAYTDSIASLAEANAKDYTDSVSNANLVFWGYDTLAFKGADTSNSVSFNIAIADSNYAVFVTPLDSASAAHVLSPYIAEKHPTYFVLKSKYGTSGATKINYAIIRKKD